MYMPMHPRHRATTGRGSGHLRTPPKFRSRNRTRAPSRASAAPGSPSLAPSAAPSSGAARGAVLVVRVVEEPSKRSDLVRVDQQHPLVPVVRVVEESSKRSETLSELISSTLLVPGRLSAKRRCCSSVTGSGAAAESCSLCLTSDPLLTSKASSTCSPPRPARACSQWLGVLPADPRLCQGCWSGKRLGDVERLPVKPAGGRSAPPGMRLLFILQVGPAGVWGKHRTQTRGILSVG